MTNLNDDGAGSLRNAIAVASSGDTINFGVNGTITLTVALQVNKNLTILGPGARKLTLNGDGRTLVFSVGDLDSTIVVTISGVTIVNGRGGLVTAGGIQNSATLTLASSVLSTNKGVPGAIGNSGTLIVSNCTLSGNAASLSLQGHNSGSGGAIGGSGTLVMSNSTLSGNSAAEYGGAIYVVGAATITNSTLAGNSARISGGAIGNIGAVTLNHTTLAGNSAGGDGGGILNSGRMIVKNSLFARGSQGGNCLAGASYATLISNGHNLSDDGSCAGVFTGPGDRNNTTAGLDPTGLRDNGGPTQTIALLPTSAAVDAVPVGPTNYCTDATDQRNVARPQGLACDIGAFELVSLSAFVMPQLTASYAAGGSGFVSLKIRNEGTIAARDILIDMALFRTLTGIGSITSANGFPLSVPNLGPGQEATIAFGVAVPDGVMRYAVSLNGRMNNISGTHYNFATKASVPF